MNKGRRWRRELPDSGPTLSVDVKWKIKGRGEKKESKNTAH